MLGKGLESLIPKQGSNTGSDDVPFPSVQEESEPHLLFSLDDDVETDGEVDIGFQESEEISRRRGEKRSEAIFYIEVEKVVPNPHQPRRQFDDEKLGELAASIREFGVLQPLIVRKIYHETATGTDVTYELIAGERRLLAARKAGLERVPVIVRSVDVERERLELAVIENLQREDLNPVEMARAFTRLQEEFRLTQREIASRLGKSREVVANTVRLLDLPAEMQRALEDGSITESHGRLLLAVHEPDARARLFGDILQRGMTTRELRHRVKKVSTGSGRKKHQSDNPELRAFEERLSAGLGAPVNIREKGNGGEITIGFYSPEELRGIIDRLTEEEGL